MIQRDLFLFGLEEIPLLARVRDHGLDEGETLRFRFDPAGGSVGLGDSTMHLPNAADVARDYLECHLLGGLLAEAAARGRAG